MNDPDEVKAESTKELLDWYDSVSKDEFDDELKSEQSEFEDRMIQDDDDDDLECDREDMHDISESSREDGWAYADEM